MKLSFKKENPSDYFCMIKRIAIKANGKECGTIYVSWDSFRVMLSVEKTEKLNDGNPNCKWMNVTFASQQGGESDGRAWVKTNWDALRAEFTLHLLD